MIVFKLFSGAKIEESFFEAGLKDIDSESPDFN